MDKTKNYFPIESQAGHLRKAIPATVRREQPMELPDGQLGESGSLALLKEMLSNLDRNVDQSLVKFFHEVVWFILYTYNVHQVILILRYMY